MSQSFKILWPEERIVNTAKIRSWYLDAEANGQLEHADKGMTAFAGSAMALALHRAGLITLARS